MKLGIQSTNTKNENEECSSWSIASLFNWTGTLCGFAEQAPVPQACFYATWKDIVDGAKTLQLKAQRPFSRIRIIKVEIHLKINSFSS